MRTVRCVSKWLEGNGAFSALLLVTSLMLLMLVGFVAGLMPLYLHEFANLCRRSWSVLLAHWPAAGATVPLLVLLVLLARGLWSLVRQVWGTRRFLQSLRVETNSLPRRLEQVVAGMGVGRRVTWVQDDRPFAFCYGFLNPRICVSTGLLALLDDAELRALLLHERYHLRQRDPLRLLVINVLADMLGMLAIVPFLVDRHRVAQEVAADQAAIRACGSSDALSSALLKLLTLDPRKCQVPLSVGAFSVTEERIARLLTDQPRLRKPAPSVWLRSFLVVFVLLLVSYSGLRNVAAVSALPMECLPAMAGLP